MQVGKAREHLAVDPYVKLVDRALGIPDWVTAHGRIDARRFRLSLGCSSPDRREPTTAEETKRWNEDAFALWYGVVDALREGYFDLAFVGHEMAEPDVVEAVKRLAGKRYGAAPSEWMEACIPALVRQLLEYVARNPHDASHDA